MLNNFTKREELINFLKFQYYMGVDNIFHVSGKNIDGEVKKDNNLSKRKTNIDLFQINSLEELENSIGDIRECNLKRTAKNLVFFDGNKDSNIMLIGEAPGRDEDILGKPFVGKAGKLLNKMMSSVGFSRNDLYFTNVIPWRPPGNRTPSNEEINMYRTFLIRHIQLKKPQIILSLGGVSSKILLNTTSGIMSLRGKIKNVDFGVNENIEMNIPILPTFHPAFLLRTPSLKKLVFQDLLLLRRQVDSIEKE